MLNFILLTLVCFSKMCASSAITIEHLQSDEGQKVVPRTFAQDLAISSFVASQTDAKSPKKAEIECKVASMCATQIIFETAQNIQALEMFFLGDQEVVPGYAHVGLFDERMMKFLQSQDSNLLHLAVTLQAVPNHAEFLKSPELDKKRDELRGVLRRLRNKRFLTEEEISKDKNACVEILHSFFSKERSFQQNVSCHLIGRAYMAGLSLLHARDGADRVALFGLWPEIVEDILSHKKGTCLYLGNTSSEKPSFLPKKSLHECKNTILSRCNGRVPRGFVAKVDDFLGRWFQVLDHEHWDSLAAFSGLEQFLAEHHICPASNITQALDNESLAYPMVRLCLWSMHLDRSGLAFFNGENNLSELLLLLTMRLSGGPNLTLSFAEMVNMAPGELLYYNSEFAKCLTMNSCVKFDCANAIFNLFLLRVKDLASTDQVPNWAEFRESLLSYYLNGSAKCVINKDADPQFYKSWCLACNPYKHSEHFTHPDQYGRASYFASLPSSLTVGQFKALHDEMRGHLVVLLCPRKNPVSYIADFLQEIIR